MIYVKILTGDNMIYSSVDNKKIKSLRKLHLKKYRDETKMFLVEGEHLVNEALKNNMIEEIFILDSVISHYDVEVSLITSEVLNFISELDTPQPIIGLCKMKKNEQVTGNVILALDRIQDPGNLGTIIRSAVAFNISTILLGTGSVDEYNSKVVRGSQGMIFNINIINCDLNSKLSDLINDEYKIYGTKVTGGKKIEKLKKTDKSVIIMGNEGEGMSKELENLCSEFIYIPMNDICESLNVGVASSIIMYEFNK